MRVPVPPIDARRATDIAVQMQSLLPNYVPEWPVIDPTTGKVSGVSAALIAIFARYAELIIERLNRVPEKNLLAFLDLLGAAPLPPQAARVPLTFSLATGSTTEALVPAGTQVAAPPPAGATEQVTFETERALVVTAVRLTALWVRDPTTDQYADRSMLAASPTGEAEPVFAGDRPIEHVFYVGHRNLLAHTAIAELTLKVELDRNITAPDLRQVVWDVWDGAEGVPLTLASDETANLTKSGKVVFSACPVFPEQTVNQQRSRWLRCRLLTPVTPATTKQDAMVRSTHLPTVKTLTLQATLDRKGLLCETLFANTDSLSQQQEFLPFGAEPKVGDTFYLACDEAFGLTNADITLHFELIQAVVANGPELRWQFWDGTEWVTLADVKDNTTNLTIAGTVKFKLPRAAQAIAVNGVENRWVRVRINKGNYGEAAGIKIENPTDKPQKITLVAATFKPPLVSKLRVDYRVDSLSESVPDVVLPHNDFAYAEVPPSRPVVPFRAMADAEPTFYLGFSVAAEHARLPNRPISLYCHTPSLPFGRRPDNPQAQTPPRLVWEYWNGKDWDRLLVRDETEALTRSGMVEFLPPVDASPRTEFNLTRFWLRVRWVSGDYAHTPNFSQFLLNTTMAAQTRTLENEVLGSGDGTRHQSLQATQVPVLAGQRLEVREPATPSSVTADVRTLSPPDRQVNEAWTVWQEVSDFHGSGPLDRHYVLDHLSGAVRFGDGTNGRIPPVGVGNIRLAWYQTGGGTAGNRPAGTVTQLQSSIPFVDRVVNVFAAAGGADAETPDDFLARAPCETRHRGYAVSLEDYEDLARRASPEVTRVQGFELFDLANDPDGRQERPGTVSLIVVPRSGVAKPIPSLELLTRVQQYIAPRHSPLVNLVIVGPEYIRVGVAVELAVHSLAAATDLEAEITATLNRFLHPLTGGLDGLGWSFGRRPHRSDLFALLEAVPGVDHVRSLKVIETEERFGATATGRFLVYAGAHRVDLTLAEGRAR